MVDALAKNPSDPIWTKLAVFYQPLDQLNSFFDSQQIQTLYMLLNN